MKIFYFAAFTRSCPYRPCSRKKTQWHESASELCGPSEKLVPTYADRRCYVVSVTDPYYRNLGFLDRSCYFYFQVAPRLYSRGWVDPFPDSLLLRKSRSAGKTMFRTLTVKASAQCQWVTGLCPSSGFLKTMKQQHFGDWTILVIQVSSA
jgi:hypothetical protein